MTLQQMGRRKPTPGVFNSGLFGFTAYSQGVSVGFAGYSNTIISFGNGITSVGYMDATAPGSVEFNFSTVMKGSSIISSIEELYCTYE